jgi:6-phosphogluconolactonase
MSSHVIWNRRTFLSTAGLTAAAAISCRPLVSEPLPSSAKAKPTPLLACVGSLASHSSATHRIETYRVEAGNWLRLCEPTPCEAPHALVMHPTRPVLYVAHSTERYLDLPRGSVSAFTVAPSGALVLLSREPLALSATYPEHLAISPDGRTLLVSATDGGSYNLLSLAEDGAIVPGLHALKQTGCGPHALQSAAHPHASIFHPSGFTAYASDLGTDRINQITFLQGVPSVANRISLPPGSGPGYLALHESSKFLVVSCQLIPALVVVTFDEKSGRPGSTLQQISLDATAAGPLSFTPTGESLYVATRTHSGETAISAFHVAHRPFRLRAIATIQIPSMSLPKQLLVCESELLLIGEGGVISVVLDQNDGFTGEHHYVLRNNEAVSIVALPFGSRFS